MVSLNQRLFVILNAVKDRLVELSARYFTTEGRSRAQTLARQTPRRQFLYWQIKYEPARTEKLVYL
jgi:hypothetical protein